MLETTPGCHNHAAHILIVDDEAHIRLPLARALSTLGHHTCQAGSGHEALHLLQQSAFNLMVLDMHMPDMGGVDVMHAARHQYPDMMIVVLTGYATLENAIAAVKSNAADFLRKPAKLNHIVSTVEQLLAQQQQRLQRKRMVDTLTQAVATLHELENNQLPAAPEPVAAAGNAFIAVGPLTLDWQRRQVTFNGQPSPAVDLTDSESAVLHRLMTQPDRIFSCRELAHAALGYDADEFDAESVIRPCIFRLRRKLETGSQRSRLICTVRGRGYHFSAAVAGTHHGFTAPATVPDEMSRATA